MKAVTPEERKELIEDIMLQHASGNETLGSSIRRLRLEVTGFDQETFARMCNMSTKALYQLEKDKANPTLNTIESILRKFGLRLGMTTVATTTYPPAPGQANPTSTTSTRGANPHRKYAGKLSRTVSLRASAKPRVEGGDKGPAE